MKHSPATIRPPAAKRATLRARRTRDRLNLRDRLASAALCLFGLALLLTVPGARAGGAIMSILGAILLGQDVRREMLAARARLRFEAVQAQRVVKRQVRRERGVRERALHLQKQQQARTLQERRAAARTATRAEARLLHRRQEEARAQRDAWIEAEADRFVAMEDSVLQAELAQVFAARGLTSSGATAGPEIDLQLRGPVSANAVARVVPADRQAGAADVEAVEAFRRESFAVHAYLISRAGFAPNSVRLASRFPITLVDPHLLASWKNQDA